MKREIFTTTNDFELAPHTKNRQSNYLIDNPNKNNGIVVYIPGFGGDLGEYTNKFCKSITKKYPNYSAMSVEYFCIKSRPQVGAYIEFEIEDKIKFGEDEINKSSEDFIKSINIKSEKSNTHYSLTGTITPPNSDYQNFGIMAALDILNGIIHAVNKYKLDKDNIILIGSSYGGYIANLVTKLYPGFIRAVFDNSSWANPKMNYIVGREINRPEFCYSYNDLITLNLFVKSPWTIKANLPNSMEKEKLSIRSFSDDDLDKMLINGGGKTVYYFCHAKEDFIADTAEKLKLAQIMISKNFIVKMDIFDDTDIDGSFIKSMSHGMGLSMITFFDLAFKFLTKVSSEVDLSKITNGNKVIEYNYHNSLYRFDYTNTPIKSDILLEQQ